MTKCVAHISVEKGEGHFCKRTGTLFCIIYGITTCIMSLLKLVVPVYRSFHAFNELVGRNSVILVTYRSADHMFSIQLCAAVLGGISRDVVRIFTVGAA